jgi:hypothetical protein
MTANRIEQIANAVLYEGYMLYPYRPSAVKNRQRWNFGVLYPRAHSESQRGNDLWKMQTECLVAGKGNAEISVKVRFLQAIARTVAELDQPVREGAPGESPNLKVVESLRVGNQMLQAWQEATEREVGLPSRSLKTLVSGGITHDFTFPATKEMEPVRGKAGMIVGVIVRTQDEIGGQIELWAEHVQEMTFKLTLRVSNTTSPKASETGNRESLLQHSLISAHSILTVQGGDFISLLEPPEEARELAAACQNVGVWPVLVGEENQRTAMLSSPIILYDYPQVAPESPGDLFDGGEIDEILSLRIMTMTDDEKREMRDSDERTRKILERTENLPEEQLMKLHGALRGLRTAKGETP